MNSLWILLDGKTSPKMLSMRSRKCLMNEASASDVHCHAYVYRVRLTNAEWVKRINFNTCIGRVYAIDHIGIETGIYFPYTDIALPVHFG